jgi:hypothetical protein
MIEHIVLIRWMESASQEAIGNVMAEVRQLKDKVPGIVDFSCGVNCSDRAKRYTHGLVARFKDRAALEAYLAHSEHLHLVQKLVAPIQNDILIFDYEF